MAQAALDADLADTPEPSEPGVEKIEARQPVATPANDDRTDAPLRPVELTGRRMPEVERYHEHHVPGGAAPYSARFAEAQRAALLDAAEAEGRAVDIAPERRTS